MMAMNTKRKITTYFVLTKMEYSQDTLQAIAASDIAAIVGVLNKYPLSQVKTIVSALNGLQNVMALCPKTEISYDLLHVIRLKDNQVIIENLLD